MTDTLAGYPVVDIPRPDVLRDLALPREEFEKSFECSCAEGPVYIYDDGRGEPMVARTSDALRDLMVNLLNESGSGEWTFAWRYSSIPSLGIVEITATDSRAHMAKIVSQTFATPGWRKMVNSMGFDAAPANEKAYAESRDAGVRDLVDATRYAHAGVGEGVQAQPDPVLNGNPSAHDLVREDLLQRKEFGLAKYGTPLQADNGRDQLRDGYEELLDFACYIRLAIDERDKASQGSIENGDIPGFIRHLQNIYERNQKAAIHLVEGSPRLKGED
jgi:hypothetical protein